MKKIFLSLFCITSFILFSYAQNFCTELFPLNEGAIMMTKSYDRNRNLLNTIELEIVKYKSTEIGNEVELKYTIFNKHNLLIEQGVLGTHCDNGKFNLAILNSSQTEPFMELLVNSPDIIGNFLFYPPTSENKNSSAVFTPPIEYPLRSKDTDKVYGKIIITNQDFADNEAVTTPVGIFNASKTKIDFEIQTEAGLKKYKHTEWYSVGAGIVRSETYDDFYNLVSYSELTTLESKASK